MIMKRRHCVRFLLIILVGIPFCIACDDKSSTYEKEIIRLQSRPLCVPLEKMKCMTSAVDSSLKNKFNAKIKLVVYTDTATCSSCALRKMHLWNGILTDLALYKGAIQCCFIFRPLPKDMGAFRLAIKQITASAPLYVDSLGILEKVNPQIPSNPDLHTFLLDENNNVLVVGNPVCNENIEEMFLQIVEEKLGKRE